MESEKMMEDLLLRMAVLLGLPAVVFLLPSFVVMPFASTKHMGVLIASLALTVAALIWSIRWGLQLTDKIQNTRLGWFGERVVSDRLEVLKTQGYAVFHDLPCVGSTGSFNLDHVVVGNGRVVVVETKTRRKPKGDPAGHKVSYDGVKLTWPWGTSIDELEQVQLNAEWLQKEFKKQLNFDVKVHAALTMPGWYVSGGPPQSPVLVENPIRLPRFITDRFQAQLSPQQTDLVTRHLERLSTDVSYEMM